MTAPLPQPAIRLDSVFKSFREGTTAHAVLRGVSASIQPGEFVALTGPSGSGKSTLLNVISGIETPDEGRVFVSGQEVSALGEPGRTLLRRRSMGFVFQFFNLVPTLNVLENLLLPLELNGVRGAAAAQRAHAMLDAVGLESRAASWADRMSGGEQQRVAIARALVHEPALILADEPTGNLDTSTGAAILDLLTSLARARGATLLIVTHTDDVVRRADRVLSIRDGIVSEPG